MWVMMHAKQSLPEKGLECFGTERKTHHCIIFFKLIILLFGSITMFDSGMFMLSFDTDYIGWKHQA